MLDTLHATTLLHALSGLRLGHPIYLYMQVGSTNAEAKRLAAGGAPEGLLVIAEEQTAGQGRAGRHWHTPPHTALALSLVLRPTLAAAHGMRLVMLAGLAACEAIEQVTQLPVQLKWPNDVLVNGKKVGGILVESGLTGTTLDYAVVGLGLNVNFSPDPALVAFPATGLAAEAGHPIDRVRLLRALLARFEVHYPMLTTQPEQLHAAWAARLTLLHTPIVVHTATGATAGEAEGVDPAGQLLVRSTDGALLRVAAGDVRLRAVE